MSKFNKQNTAALHEQKQLTISVIVWQQRVLDVVNKQNSRDYALATGEKICAGGLGLT